MPNLLQTVDHSITSPSLSYAADYEENIWDLGWYKLSHILVYVFFYFFYVTLLPYVIANADGTELHIHHNLLTSDAEVQTADTGLKRLQS